MNFMLAYLLGLHTESEVGQPNMTSFTNEPHNQAKGKWKGYIKSSTTHEDFRDMYIAFPTHQPNEAFKLPNNFSLY